METYQEAADLPPSVSTVNVPIRLNAAEIERLLNNKLNGDIYVDNNLDDDGLMLKATRTQNINIRLDGFQMTYRVPVKVWVFKKLLDNFVTGKRGIEAEGELALNFRTTIDIRPDWTVEPRTEMVGHEWLRNMAVKTGIGNIDVKYIADNIISRSRTTLTTAIDQQLRTQFQIRKNIEEAWILMQKVVPIQSSYGTWWVKLTPQNIEMTPFQTSGDVLQANISIQSLAEVAAGTNQPTFRPDTYLPPFKQGYANTDVFQINLSTDVPIIEAENLAKSFAIGQVFQPAGKRIEVRDIQIFGQDDKLVINTSFSGSYTGSLYLVGRPVYNPQKNAIEMQDMDYDLQTRDFLLNSAKWLFDRTILKKMQEACVFPLDENVKSFQNMMNEQLKNYRFNNNVSIKGYVENIKVDDIKILKDKIKIYISSKGKLNLDVEGLDKF
jgi:LEA14-like dessication related protein